jgi:hypothetical protein
MAHGLQGFPQSSYYGKSKKNGSAPAPAPKAAPKQAEEQPIIPETPVQEEAPVIPETVATVEETAPILNETTTTKKKKKKTEPVVETPVEE